MWPVVRSFIGFNDTWAVRVHSSDGAAACRPGLSDASVADASVAGTCKLVGYISAQLCRLAQLGQLVCHFICT